MHSHEPHPELVLSQSFVPSVEDTTVQSDHLLLAEAKATHTVTVCSQISTLREQYNVWQLHLMLYTLISSDTGGVACTEFISEILTF